MRCAITARPAPLGQTRTGPSSISARPTASAAPTPTCPRRGGPTQRYPLLSRDYRRAPPATAAAYAELKRLLAASLANPDDYPEVKDPAVDLIYFAAEEWAELVGWTGENLNR